MPVISPEGIKALKAYEYKSGGYSPLDKILNVIWWEPISQYLPRWMAPNLVTLIGFLMLVVSVLLNAYFSPDFRQPAPGWVYLFVAFCQFGYQTMDAIDGKHARNTKSSSPLGQLFDHGCDSLGCCLVAVPLANAVGFGVSPLSLVLICCIQAGFFIAQWEEYFTHTMRTFTGYLGVTESQLLGIVVISLRGILGEHFFSDSIAPYLGPLGGILQTLHVDSIGRLLLCVTIGGTSFLVYSSIQSCFKHIETDAAKTAEAKRTLIPICVLLAFGCFYQSTEVFQSHPWVGFATIGAAFAHQATQVIVKSLTREPYSPLQPIILPIPFVLLNSYSPLLFNRSTSFLNESLIHYLYFAFVLYEVFYFVSCAINEITAALGIYCFKLGKRSDAPQTNQNAPQTNNGSSPTIKRPSNKK